MNVSSGTNQEMVSAELAHEATQCICTVFAKKELRDVARINAKKDVIGDESHLEIGKMTVSVFYRCDIVAQATRVLYTCNACHSQDVDVEAFLGSLAHQASKFYCSLVLVLVNISLSACASIIQHR